MRRWICAVAVACVLPDAAGTQQLRADIACHKVAEADTGPLYDCVIKLIETRTRAPVSEAKFTVSADMPSMPMAHNFRPVIASAAGEPGIYRVRLALEMYGSWMIKLHISSPIQDQIGKKIEFMESD